MIDSFFDSHSSCCYSISCVLICVCSFLRCLSRDFSAVKRIFQSCLTSSYSGLVSDCVAAYSCLSLSRLTNNLMIELPLAQNGENRFLIKVLDEIGHEQDAFSKNLIIIKTLATIQSRQRTRLNQARRTCPRRNTPPCGAARPFPSCGRSWPLKLFSNHRAFRQVSEHNP